MPSLHLGLDAGGTATRWLLADEHGREHARGQVAGCSATMFGTVQQPLLDAALAQLAQALRGQALPLSLCAGLTGFDGTLGDAPGALHEHIARALGLDARRVMLVSDIELACRAVFAPGEGILVIAGTGSIAAHLAADGNVERAGGRGGLLDDGGSGYWIARQALRKVWRREDEAPGAWTQSTLARELFAQLGDASWARTREFVAGASRGEMGALATAVARAAQAGDADAQALLDDAGRELARIANALLRRVGPVPRPGASPPALPSPSPSPLPVALAGRVGTLDARIAAVMKAALQPGVSLSLVEPDAALAAARLAADTITANVRAGRGHDNARQPH
jgi:glucosamine kinase